MKRLPRPDLDPRIAVVAALTLPLFFVVPALRSADKTGMASDLFWQAKVQWAEEADVVIGGDSRIYRGVSPAAVSAGAGWSGLRIRNFGFSNAALDTEYLEATERVLDPKSTVRLVVLGVTPHSLTPRAARNNDFLDQRRVADSAAFSIAPLFGNLLEPLQPIGVLELMLLMLSPDDVVHYKEDFRADGWVKSSRQPEAPRSALADYREKYATSQVDPALVAQVVEFTRECQTRGIRVAAFRPPVSAEMDALEGSSSGVNWAELRKGFTDAGGLWLEPVRTGFHSYDGSHLGGDQAEAFSHALGRELGTRLGVKPPRPAVD